MILFCKNFYFVLIAEVSNNQADISNTAIYNLQSYRDYGSSVLQNVNFATTTTNTERFVCNRQKIALNSVANLYVNSLQNNKQSIRSEER